MPMGIRETFGMVAGLMIVLAACNAPSPPSASAGGAATDPALEVPGGSALEKLPSETTGFPDVDRWGVLASSIEAHVDSTDRQLRRVPNLSAAERRNVRADVNAVQIAQAQRLGIPRRSDPSALLRSGRLVELADSTEHWTVRQLDYSAPYVTPDTHALLVEIGERFHAALDSLALPRFRFEITSVLRTPANQAALQRSNPNAARGVSAHEFGTTVDIAYRRFSPPLEWQVPGGGELSAPAEERLRQLHDVLMVEMATQRGAELQAILGRVMGQMRREGKLLVMMENQQTVYHTTLARPHSGARRAAGD